MEHAGSESSRGTGGLGGGGAEPKNGGDEGGRSMPEQRVAMAAASAGVREREGNEHRSGVSEREKRSGPVGCLTRTGWTSPIGPVGPKAF